jgi:hypothetical protein
MKIGIGIGIPYGHGTGGPKTAGSLHAKIGFPLLTMPDLSHSNLTLLFRDKVADAGGFESGAVDDHKFLPSLIGRAQAPIPNLTLLMGKSGVGATLLQQVIALYGGGAVTGTLYDVSQLSSLYEDRSASPSTPASIDGVVGTIKDLSPNGDHAIAPSDAARGILRTDGTYYWIEFDGLITSYVVTNATTQNIFIGNSFKLNAVDTQVIGIGAFSPKRLYAPLMSSGNDFNVRCGNSGTGIAYTPTADTPYIVVLTDEAGVVRGYINGTEMAGSPSANTSFLITTTYLGNNDIGWEQSADWHGGALLQTTLPTADRQLVERWLASLNGVTLS